MAAHLPEIVVSFKQKAATFFTRSTRGVLFLIVREANPDTESEDPLTPYVTEMSQDTVLTAWNETNQQYIKDVLAVDPYKFFVVTIDTNGTIKSATDLIELTYPTGRVTMVGVAADYSALVTWAKGLKKYHVLTHATTGSNSRYVENLYAQQIVWDDDDHGTGAQSSITFLPTLGALLCKANTAGVTYAVVDQLKKVTNVGNETAENAAINAGNLILRNDWKGTDQVVRIGTAVNTLTTFDDSDNMEDFRYIEVAEAADMIREDISSVFRDSYVGKKNSFDNQILFISQILQYFDELADEEIINPDGSKTVEIDADAQREAWIRAMFCWPSAAFTMWHTGLSG